MLKHRNVKPFISCHNGAVSYASDNPAVASVTGSTVTILGEGTFTVTATKAADAHYAEAKVTSHAVTVYGAVSNGKPAPAPDRKPYPVTGIIGQTTER